MAYTNGNATNYRNLLEVLRDFLVAQDWELIGGQAGAIGVEDFVSLRGPGLSGNDQILLSLTTHTNVPSAHYCIGISGHTAYAAGAPSATPPGLNSPRVFMPLINTTIRYWIVANGRRFVMVTRSNSRYDAMYGGFVLPEHLPSDWPYPLLVGASSTIVQAGSADGVTHSNFWRGPRTAYLFTPEQLWRPFDNVQPSGSDNNGSEVALANGMLCAADWKTNMGVWPMARTLDDQPWVRRGRIAQFGQDALSARNFLGHYDGVYFTPSAGAIVESEIEIGDDRYLVVPNIYRNTSGQMAAIHLE